MTLDQAQDLLVRYYKNQESREDEEDLVEAVNVVLAAMSRGYRLFYGGVQNATIRADRESSM